MAIIREFNLHTNAGLSIPPVIHVNQYDRGETWKFKLYQPNGQQLTPTDAAIVGIKSDGHIIANAGTVSGGVISITETEQMTAAPGKAVFEILFDNDTHGTANFIVLVEPSPTEGGIASDSDLSLFQEAIDSISPATINAAVSAWMSAQLTPSEWVIDNSLTVANAAADAKAAGDLIRQNTADIGDLTDLVTEDQSSLVGAINETRTDLYNWFTDDIEKVKYIYDGSAQDADIYEVKRLEWAAADDADITGMKVITRKEGTSTDTSKFFVDGNELMEYVIGDTSDLDGTITEEISDLRSQIALLSGVPTAVKNALDTLFQNVAFKNDGDYSSELTAVHTWASAVNLLSISAVYTQSKTVYTTSSLDSLKDDLVVTASYDNGTTSVLSDSSYTLSGTLTVGTSTVTVSYSGKTTTFNVTVSAEPQYIFATQGNDFISTPTTATNRCSVRVKNRRAAPQDTLSVGCASGYAIYQYAIVSDNTASDDGTLSGDERSLNTKVTADNGDNVPNGDISNNVSPSQGGSRSWIEAGATTLHNTWSSNGMTVGVIGFIIKKTDESDITPQEAINAIVITGHTPLE